MKKVIRAANYYKGLVICQFDRRWAVSSNPLKRRERVQTRGAIGPRFPRVPHLQRQARRTRPPLCQASMQSKSTQFPLP